MKVAFLDPSPTCREVFRRDCNKFIPESAGCYALVSFESEILYIGKTQNLRLRCGQHLDDQTKLALTPKGRAFFFYWLQCREIELIERTWLNECELSDGRLPIFNKISSPLCI